jgi:hypothetical protein
MPESYVGGQYYYDAITSVGEHIAQSIQYYRQRHDEMSQLDKQLEFMTRIPDVGGKPTLNPKELERIRATYTGPERYNAERGLLDAISMGTQLQKAHADITRSIMNEPYGPGGGNILYDQQGNPYAQRNPRTGVYSKFPQPPQAGDVSALRRHANSLLSAWGMTGDEFNTRVGDRPEHGETPGYAPPSTADPTKLDTDKFQSGPELGKKGEQAGVTPDQYNAVRFKVGDRKMVVPKTDMDIVKKMYPRKGDPGYQERVKVGQPQSGSAVHYPLGTRARRGNTWYTMTDKGWKAEQSQQQPQVATEDTGEENADE